MDKLQEHLDHALSGNKKIKPDEQQLFLGTFRERVFLTMTLKEIGVAINFEHFKQEVEKIKVQGNLFLKINGNVSDSLQMKYIKIASAAKVEFTIVNNNVGKEQADLALVLHGKEAINRATIDVGELYPQVASDTKQTQPAKKPFWKRFF